MLAARDQENLAYAHQQAAASKPLNQAPKTPGPRGNFASNHGALTGKKVLRHDENQAPMPTGKKALGGKENIGITPAPRERAPLGAKTTNAKAKGLQTPAPLSGARQGLAKIRQQSISNRKSKLKIHQQLEPVTSVDVAPKLDDSDEDFVPEVEFCPPKIQELPDYPDPDDPFEIKPDEEFPQFSRDNYFRGAYQVFGNRDANALAESQRRMRESDRLDDEYIEEQSRKAATMLSLGLEDDAGQVPAGQPDATSTRQRRPTSVAHFAKPTASTAAKAAAPPRRMTPGVAASRTTMGRAKGRQVSASMKDHTGREREATNARHKSKLLDDLCGDEHDGVEYGLEYLGIDFTPLAGDEFENFQLDIPASP